MNIFTVIFGYVLGRMLYKPLSLLITIFGLLVIYAMIAS